jgi:hypothetical protein
MQMKIHKLIPLGAATVLAAALTAGCFPASAGSGGSGGTTGASGGRPPCAARGSDGAYGADAQHPERAPLVAERTFPHGVRWAVCGASPIFDTGLLNLRSRDGGRTWTTTDTGVDVPFSPNHAGDVVEVELIDPTHATIHMASPVGEVDLTYSTNDGGRRWRAASGAMADSDLTD